jgi:hypothetical protein
LLFEIHLKGKKHGKKQDLTPFALLICLLHLPGF